MRGRRFGGRAPFFLPRTSRGALKKLWPLFVISVAAYERVSQHIREVIWSQYDKETFAILSDGDVRVAFKLTWNWHKVLREVERKWTS